MGKKTECRITVTEVDGRLHLIANIPDGAEKTIGGALTRAMLEEGNVIMNRILKQDQKLEEFTQQ